MINPQDINLKELEDKYMRRCLLCPYKYCSNPKHIPSWVIHYEDIKKIISDKLNRIEKKIDNIIINNGNGLPMRVTDAYNDMRQIIRKEFTLK